MSARSGDVPTPRATSLWAIGERRYAWFVVAGILVGLGALLRGHMPWLVSYPTAWVVPLTSWINALFEWLAYDLSFGLFTFRDLTRGVSWVLERILGGSEAVFFEGWLGAGPLPWVTLVVLVAVLGHYTGGWRTAAVGAACFAYLAIFGVWIPALGSFSLVIVTVPFAAAIGLGIGILALRRRRLEDLLTPVLNVMQATPHFAYLVPVVVLFGFGQVPALIATAIFAIPPMARCTIVGVRSVPTEVVEAGRMAGCTPRQLLWKLELPSARPTLLLGLNQVIMMTLAMVVIASLIGASGLGSHVLNALGMLKLGKALELGVGIVVLAVALDRVSQAYARKKPERRERDPRFRRRHPHLVIGGSLISASLILAWWLPALRIPSPDLTITTAPVWDALVDWVTITFYDQLMAVRSFVLLNVLIPIRDALLWVPWPAVVAVVGLLGYRLGGMRLALLVTALALFPAVTGFWEPAMRTLYMIGAAVMVCILLGFPIGLFASRHDRAAGAIMAVCDTLQTFPSFIYLIPVVMLFKTGDVAAITAVVVYAIVPMIRYTNAGLREVPAETVEAVRMMGCTRRQLLWKIQMPMALPHLMLGVNQTIMLGLFMVAITALIGTQDLGQEINKALSGPDTGAALVAGLCVAFIGLIADQLISRWSVTRKQQLGLA